MVACDQTYSSEKWSLQWLPKKNWYPPYIKGRQAISNKQHFAPHYSPNKCHLLGLLYYIPHFSPLTLLIIQTLPRQTFL